MDLSKVNALIDQLRAEVNASAPQPPVTIETPDALDRAISTQPGAVLLLSPSLLYPAPLMLTAPITLRSAALIDGRMSADFPCPRFLGGITLAGDGIALDGLHAQSASALESIVTDIGRGNIVDRCRLMGTAVGQRRGIAGNGINSAYTRNYIAGIFAPQPGAWTDSNGIAVWDTPGPTTIADNFIEASSEGLLFGGGDPSAAGRDPSDLTIIENWITKDLAWRTAGHNCKNGIEFKNARRFRFYNNDVLNVWGGSGQVGVALVLTVRNQDGRNPTATIQDGDISGNRFTGAASAISVLALEDIKEIKDGRDVPIGAIRRSERMARIKIDANLFTDIVPATWFPAATSPKLTQFSGGPSAFELTNNGFEAAGFNSVMYFDKGPKAEEMVVAGNVWPWTKYGIFGAGVAVNKTRDGAWAAFVASGRLANNTELTA